MIKHSNGVMMFNTAEVKDQEADQTEGGESDSGEAAPGEVTLE